MVERLDETLSDPRSGRPGSRFLRPISERVVENLSRQTGKNGNKNGTLKQVSRRSGQSEPQMDIQGDVQTNEVHTASLNLQNLLALLERRGSDEVKVTRKSSRDGKPRE